MSFFEDIFGTGTSEASEELASRGRMGLDLATSNQQGLFDNTTKFSSNFFKNRLLPAVRTSTRVTNQTLAQLQGLIGQTQQAYNVRENWFQNQGLGLINDFKDMVTGFDRTAYADELGKTQAGDIYNQSLIAQDQINRELASRGVSASSAQATSAAAENALITRLAVASAKQRARQAATDRETELKSAGANLGVTSETWADNQAGLLGNLMGMRESLGNNTFGNLLSAGNFYNQGTQLAGNLNAPLYQGALGMYTGAMKTQAEEEAANSAGIGGLLGGVASIGLGIATQNPMFALQGIGSLTGGASSAAANANNGNWGLFGLK